MGKIKSALEIALERTESVKGDKDRIGQYEAKQKGKKLANQFLEGNVKSLTEEIEKEAADGRASFKQGLFDVLISQMVLPAAREEIKRIETSCQGLLTVIGGKHFTEIARQVGQMMNQYLNEAAQYEEAIKRQYAPKLRQKEEELSRRLGRHVKLDPFQDPEFVTYYNQNINNLKANYEAIAEEIQKQAESMFTL